MAKELHYAVDLGAGGELRDESGAALRVPPEWTPEHLLLAALIRCSLAGLRYHAERAGLAVGASSGSVHALVTRRESEERYAIAQADVELDVEVEPQPGHDELGELLAKAERDCFVGSSLTSRPRYHWTVNGRSADDY
ncbi:MAG TPA: OsmC family protein [Gaiellaceae bacterium]|nr:OsmC family protein [Gaiellaceae bacterium]